MMKAFILHKIIYFQIFIYHIFNLLVNINNIEEFAITAQMKILKNVFLCAFIDEYNFVFTTRAKTSFPF